MENLSPETVELLHEDDSFDIEAERNKLASKVQSAEDRLANLNGQLEARKAELIGQAEEESRLDRSELENRLQRLRNAIAELASVQPAG